MTTKNNVRIKKALISVSNKQGLVNLASSLTKDFGVEIIASGGTYNSIKQAKLNVSTIDEMTKSPEILGGRVKTLHPIVHAGLLYDPEITNHQEDKNKYGFDAIDLLVVNLYPFMEVISNNASFEEAIENIDIGGVALLRAAAKNHKRVTTICDVADYEKLLQELQKNNGEISHSSRMAFAHKTFAHVAQYDNAISDWFSQTIQQTEEQKTDEPSRFSNLQPINRPPYTGKITINTIESSKLRYGENSHQEAIACRTDDFGVLAAEQIQGKQLSYNNVLDADAALKLNNEFMDDDYATAVIVKHGTPCGVARNAVVATAFTKARECDPISAFGGILSLNKTIDAQTAKLIVSRFFEIIIAPDVSAEAREILKIKPDLRVLLLGEKSAQKNNFQEIRQIHGGILLQTSDNISPPYPNAEVVTERSPTIDEINALNFAAKVVKHLKSNAVVITNANSIEGAGAAQTSRVDSAVIATNQANKFSIDTVRVAASDGFFPKPDAMEELLKAGVTAIIQPGGSKGDGKVIEAANAQGIAMIFSHVRHFCH